MAELKRFEPDEIQLTQEEAWHVLRFFWPNTNVPPGSLSPEDRGFAQGLMIEAVERSYAMGYVESLYRSFFGPGVAPTSSALKKAIKSFAKKAIKNWFRHASGKDLEDPKIYESVRRSLARNFRSVWEIRAQTGELTY
jgi:hypothetical protein